MDVAEKEALLQALVYLKSYTVSINGAMIKTSINLKSY